MSYHTKDIEHVLALLETSQHGLENSDAASRLIKYGKNILPKATHISVLRLFFKQFLDPLIYVLLFAAFMSLIIGEYTDAGFIFFVLIVNALIGLVQEYSAQHSAASLDILVTNIARVIRSDDTYEINSEDLVLGDIVLLESGDMVPADLRLITQQELRIDESLLSGESLPVEKDAFVLLEKDSLIQERINMAFSGTLVINGRAMGVVTATGIHSELGKIAEDVLHREKIKPPLLIRMEKFTWRLTWVMGLITLLIAAIVLYQGMPWMDVFLLSVALAVAAIPEGLPVAITIALAISIRRMAKRHVIARNLVAVEALGSCTYIATDKTGTLTRNEITVEKLVLPNEIPLTIPTHGIVESDQREQYRQSFPSTQHFLIDELGLAMVLTNEAFIGHRDGSWSHHGDSMDVALLIMGYNLGLSRTEQLHEWRPVSLIAFESARRYSASMHIKDNQYYVFAKGAFESIVDMCTKMNTIEGVKAIDENLIFEQAHQLAKKGYRVLAAASASITPTDKYKLHDHDLQGLTFLGLTGMIDPLRQESKDAVKACQTAGIEVAMLTGDHQTTAYAIAHQLGLVQDPEQIITSRELHHVINNSRQSKNLLANKLVYARLEPHQKLDIVTILQDSGHFVAMTGDGANDAPALRAAHVGVAMGKTGSAVARETADIILTDDNFSSLIAGVEEGRIAYSNVRKVIHLLISTGAGEIVLFLLSLLFGLPIPLTAIQLLWLNLVTNGIQDVALAFEPGEGDELTKPPRKPDEAIFNRVMIERVLLSAVVIGFVAFISFYYLLSTGMTVEGARNGTLLLMVLFENIHVMNSRSETKSALQQSLFQNKLLIISVIGAQVLHIVAMNVPIFSKILEINPISPLEWSQYLFISLSLLVVSEIYKQYRRM
jgi:magnesium-transporting ATPase (P-type)